MNLIDIDLISELPSAKNFYMLKDNEYPFCILGFQIKNAYDQARLNLKEYLNAKDYVHYLPKKEKEVMCFRGIKITPKNYFSPLLTQFSNFNTNPLDISKRRYESIIHEYGLTCKNCYSLLQKGVYPIDGECIGTFVRENININNLYENAFNLEQVPLFQSYAYFTIFILENKSIFKG